MRDLIASLTAVLHELLGQYDTVFHKSTRARVVEVTHQAGLRGLQHAAAAVSQMLWLPDASTA